MTKSLPLWRMWVFTTLMFYQLIMSGVVFAATILDAGGHQICGIQADDSVVCWGDNEKLVPKQTFSQISVGGFHSCGVQTNDAITCWVPKWDAQGQATPPKDTFYQVSAGYYHTCGVTTDNIVKCWGKNKANDYGQATPPDDTFLQVSVGRWHTCGIKTDNTVACWGSNTNPYATENEYQATPSGTFYQVGAAMSGWHTCGVRTDNSVACWGSNNHGQATPPNGTFSHVSAGKWHTCGLRTDNTITCWGSDSDGQATPPSGTFYSVSAGVFETCGIRANNTVVCWGANSDGRIKSATGSFVKSPVSSNVCFHYGVQDYVNKQGSANNTQLLTINNNTFEINAFGKPYEKLNFQSLDFHPLTNQLFALTSTKGKLHKVDHKTLIQKEFGSTGFKTVDDITFHPDGTLWGWTPKQGLFQFNSNKQNEPNLKKANIILPYQEELEALTWNGNGTILYAVANFDQSTIVWAYKPDEEAENAVSTVCNNLINSLGTEITTMETLQDNTLLFSFHENDNLNLVAIDVQTCKVVKQTEVFTDFNKIKSIAWSDCSHP